MSNPFIIGGQSFASFSVSSPLVFGVTLQGNGLPEVCL